MNKRIEIKINQCLTAAQVRVGLDPETVERYAEYLSQEENNAPFPPIEVIRAVCNSNDYIVVDGHHRLEAYKQAGLKTIQAIVLQTGDIGDAIFLAAGANQRHGLPRTKADIRNAVKEVLKAKDRLTPEDVRRQVGCSLSLVYEVKKELEETGEVESKATAAQKVEQALKDESNATKSNRELAKELDVDEKTVRKARNNSTVEKIRAPEEEKLDKIATDAQAWLDDREPQEVNKAAAFDEVKWLADFEARNRPTLNKVTEETRRVVPEVEKPVERVVKADSIPLKDVDNIAQIVDDVCQWLGDRVETFKVLFLEKLKEEK